MNADDHAKRSKTAILPRKLTAENGAKAALIGEFYEDFGQQDEHGNERWCKVAVTWDTIKRIWEKAVEHFDAHPVAPVQGSANKDELLRLADQQAYARARYNEDDADLIRESKVIEGALRQVAALAQRPIGYISPTTKHALEIDGTDGPIVATPAFDTEIPVYLGAPAERLPTSEDEIVRDHMIACLRGRDDKLCHDAADEIEELARKSPAVKADGEQNK